MSLRSVLLLIGILCAAFDATAKSKAPDLEIFQGNYTGFGSIPNSSSDTAPADFSFTSGKDGRFAILVIHSRFLDSSSQAGTDLGTTFVFWKGTVMTTGDDSLVGFYSPNPARFRWKATRRKASIEASVPAWVGSTPIIVGIRIEVKLRGRNKDLSVLQTIPFGGSDPERYIYNGTAKAPK